MNFENDERISPIFNKIRRNLKARGFENVNDYDIYDEISNAIEAVNSKRRFVPTSNVLFESQYSNLITRLCISSIAKWGAEGESSHSENGISRNYEDASGYPPSMLAEVIPLGKAR